MSGKSKSSTSSTIHIDSPKSSTSSRSKYYKGMMFEKLMLKNPEKGIPEVDRVFSMPELPRSIYEQYKKSLKYEQYKIPLKFFVDGISLENLNIVSLALNPRLSPSFAKELIEMISNNKAKLKEFYHNLAKNENHKVFSILRKEYRDFPNSDKLGWDALSANPNAISILVKEYNKNPLSNKIGLCFLSKNTHICAIRILKKIIYSENNLKNRICFHFLSNNPTAITLLRKEKNRNHLLNNTKFNLSENPNISELKEMLVEEANFNKLDMEKLAGNPFAPRELLEKLIDKLKQKNSYNLYKLSSNFSMNPNPEAVKLLREEYVENSNSELINLFSLSKNINPEAIKLLREIIRGGIIRPNRYNLSYNLAENPTSEAITLLKELNKIGYIIINWDVLSGNPHPEAITLLRDKIEKERTKPIIGQGRINWEKISANTGAFELIIEKLKKEQPDASGIISEYDIKNRINKDKLSTNPAIFVKYEKPAVKRTTATERNIRI